MTPFSYKTPASLSDALSALAAGGPNTKILAGGQSLLLALKERQARPTGLVAVKNLRELQGLRDTADGALAIGPAMTYAVLAKTVLPGWHAELATVAGKLADRSVRNMGTVGGGVCQADPRYDMPVFLSGAAARFILTSARASRTLSAQEFFSPAGGTSIAPDEILTSIALPALSAWSQVAFEKFCFRSFEAAIVNVAGALLLDAQGRIQKFRIAVGGIAKAPSIALQSTNGALGKEIAVLDKESFAVQVSREVLPPETATTRLRKYQAELTISLVKRVLTRLGAGALEK